MADDMKKMKKFFIDIFNKDDNPKGLTKRNLRQKYLDHFGLKSLNQEQEDVFSKAICEAFIEFEKQNLSSDVEDDDFKEKPSVSKKRKTLKNAKTPTKKRIKKNKSSQKSEESSNDSDEDFKLTKESSKQQKNKKGKQVYKKPVKRQVKADQSSSEEESVVEHKSDSKKSRKVQTNKKEIHKSISTDNEEEHADKVQNDEGSGDNNSPKVFSPTKKNIPVPSSSESEDDHNTILKPKPTDKENSNAKQKKTRLSKPKSTRKESSDEKDESDVEKMKSYIRTAGIRVNSYSKLFEDCSNSKDKINKLKLMLEKAGLKGRPSIKTCKKLKEKLETAKEIAELDTDNIIESDSGRSRRSQAKTKKTSKKQSASDSGNETKAIFSSLKDIVDSD